MQLLKEQSESDVCYIEILSNQSKQRFKNNIFWTKFVMFSFAANPVILVSAIIKLNLQVKWDIFASHSENLDKVLILFYIVYVVSSCTVYYTHMLVYIYFNTYFKLQMEALSKYFEDLSVNNKYNWESGELVDVYDQLISGIQLHARLSRYVTYAWVLYTSFFFFDKYKTNNNNINFNNWASRDLTDIQVVSPNVGNN